MAVTSALSPVSLTSYFDDATGAVKHANLFFYKAGTLDAISVYTDALLSVAHPVPVITTGNGRVPPVFIGEMPAPGYRIRAFDQYSQLIEDIDNLPGAIAPTTDGGGEPITPTDAMLKVGDILASFTDSGTARSGFVRCNGGTIGAALSDATEMRDDRAYALFMHLWQQDQSLNLAVYAIGGSPSRGASAQGDWDLSKTIATPDLCGRGLIGVSPMGKGGTVPDRMAGAVVDSINGDAKLLGAYGGRATAVLDITQMPSHNHNITETAHQHYGVTPDHLHHNVVSIGGTYSAHDHYITGYTGSENATHTHYQIGGDPALQGFGDTGGRVSAYQGAQTGGQSTNHQHPINFWSRSGDGVHAHNAVHSPAGADRSLAFWVDARTAGVTSVAAGGGLAHNNAQPFYAVTFYMKW